MEISALNKGLNFNILPNYFDFLQVQASFERLYQETRQFLSCTDRIEFKRIIINLYSKYKSSYFFSKNRKQFNINEDIIAALKKLSRNASLIICKPDKGNGVVVMNKIDYIQKMKQILLDRTKFKSVSENNNLKQLSRFQNFLARLKNVGAIDQTTYKRIRPVATTIPTLYGLPKIHKENNPLRPILSSIGSYQHECAAWLSEILSPLREHHSSVKDTFDFLRKIKDVNIQNKVMSSLDVKSLFTNIPVDFTVNLILDSIFINDVKKFQGLNRQQLKKLLKWSCSGTVFQFNEELFEQTDGVAMGSPIAPLMADICMNWVIGKCELFNEKPVILLRYVDDIFCVFDSKLILNQFYNKINAVHPNIRFSVEMEHNNQLAFLDVLLTKCHNVLETTVFRKKTNTGLYMKWSSLCPIKYKRNLINCLLERSYRICSSYLIMHREFQNITNMMLSNEYPIEFIQNQIRHFLNKKFSKNVIPRTDSTQKQNVPRLIIKLPFVGNSSMHIEKELQSFFRRKLSDKVKLMIVHNCHAIGNMFKHKDKQPLLYRNNVVYKLSCSCGSIYIGQTRRNLQSRMDEHNPMAKHQQQSDVIKHLSENPGHSIDFSKPEILTSAYNPRELLIKETLLIQQYKPEINSDTSSHPLYVFNN